MNGRVAGIAASVILVSLFLTLSREIYGGLYAYFVPAMCWGAIFLITLLVAGKDFIRRSFSRSVTLIGLSIAAVQIFLMIDVGLISGFGRNPIVSSPASILLSLILVGSTLAGIELSRSYVVKAACSKRPTLGIALVSVLYTFVYVAFYDLIFALSFVNPLFSVDFIGGTLIPVFAANLFVSFLSLLGGPLGAWAYMVPTYSLTWFAPILPDLSWGFKALLGVLPPLMGFIYINYVITIRDFRRAGVLVRNNPRERSIVRRREKAERASIVGWALIAALGVSMVYFAVGLLPIYPIIPISGSMSPTFDVGDMVILEKVSADFIKPGDIIEYLTQNGPVIHRVKSIETLDSQQLIITQGDANNIPDSPISFKQVRGRVALIIPKVGWASIYLKEGVMMAWTFVNTLAGIIAVSCASVLIAAYGVYRYKNQPYWTRLKRGGI